tara:strand:+ start:158 stop:901 length:744 start_codon:yes stop_codon:yes gene_type:complete
MKSIINNFLRRFLKIEIKKFHPRLGIFTNLHLKTIKRSPVIFDIGANEGQSIERYLKTFDSPKIYAFEPNEDAFQILFEKYSKNKNIILNNFAIGEKKGNKYLHYTIKSGNSSIFKLNMNSYWIKNKALSFDVKPKNYVNKIKKTKIFSLDNYIKKEKINSIDLLKIDTQGYEYNVLMGSKNSLKKKIKNIELEIMLDNCYNADTNIYKIEKILNPKNFKIKGIYANKRDFLVGDTFGCYLFYKNLN